MEKSTSRVATVVEMAKLDVSAVQGCIEEVMQVQRVQSLGRKMRRERKRKKGKRIL